MNQTDDPLRHPVLVVGAGPTGLTAATELGRRGVAVRCVDRAPAPSPYSKALAVWPRTLEIFERLGGARLAGERGMPMESFRYYSSGRRIARIRFDDTTRPMVLPQPDVEELLAESLAKTGERIQWGTELVALERRTGGVVARLRGSGGEERSEEFSYVLGCDGANSSVRGLSGIGFEGETYPLMFVVADVRIDGNLAHDANHYFCSPQGIVVVAGLPAGHFRIFTSAPPGVSREDLTLDLVRRLVHERGPGGLTVHSPTWISGFSVHARHAATWRVDRVFLAGDAAHIHSPAGGQGLNTGVGDAYNLAWKLALVWHGHARTDLLDTYEPERSQVARAVVRQADVQTRAWLLQKKHHVALRDAAVRAISGLRLANLAYVPSLAGLRTVYPTGAGDTAGRRTGGITTGALLPDRMVWDERRVRRIGLRQALGDGRFTLLVSAAGSAPLPGVATTLLDWVRTTYPDLVEVRFLDTRDTLRDTIDPRSTASRRFATGPVLALVRPDQHVALCRPARDASAIHDLLRMILRPPTPPVRRVPHPASTGPGDDR
jgi:3-(3-hydroxy-phenyl)propionate hydroxylase